MKKIWVKKRFQKTGHSRRFGRFTHVFRSCRKQSYGRTALTSCQPLHPWNGPCAPSLPPSPAPLLLPRCCRPVPTLSRCLHQPWLQPPCPCPCIPTRLPPSYLHPTSILPPSYLPSSAAAPAPFFLPCNVSFPACPSRTWLFPTPVLPFPAGSLCPLLPGQTLWSRSPAWHCLVPHCPELPQRCSPAVDSVGL
nr:vegetative cell wall protein gp1-like [Dromaius novaehollandiae]